MHFVLIDHRQILRHLRGMTWTLYAVGAAVALAVADCLVKLAAGKLPHSLALLLYGCVPFSVGLVWFLTDRARNGMPSVAPLTIAYSLGVGVAFTLVTIALYATFRAGAPMSVASPLIRVGGLLLASFLGVLIWQEVINARYLLGVLLALAGIYLIVKN
jgi:drug/metabolite transporter (DMT)-like permease